ncbi:hypothetical protein [Evansella clarkii]|uniref:hypothetical protein n=1 Tax=Evansella clarkii TaxID=79879 RepID=UPI000997D42E|nr:hypothetical protein [Evansella clarkii]
MARWVAFLAGALYIDFLFHSGYAHGFGFEATTMAGRLGALFFVLIVTLLVYYISYKFFPPSFFHGVIFASGFFASFDIIVIHWVFQLHRLTYGPEVVVLEPLLVIAGIAMIIFSVKREKNLQESAQ